MMKNKAVLVLLTFVLLFQTVTSSLFLAGGVSADQSDKEDVASVFNDVHILNEEGESPEPGKSEAVTVTVDWTTEEVDVHESYEESLQLPEEVEVEESTGDLIAEDGEGESVTVGTYQVTEEGLVTVLFRSQPSDKAEKATLNLTEEKSDPSENAEISSEDQMTDSEENNEESIKDEKQVTETENAGSEEEEVHVFEGSFSFSAVYTSLEGEEDAETGEVNKEEMDKDEGYEDRKESDEEKESESLNTSDSEFSMMSNGNVITENIITNVTVKKDGVTLEDGTALEIEPPFSNTSLELSYDFELMDGHGYTDGASYTIPVPDMFTIPQIPESGAIDLTRADGTVFGTFYADGNDIIIVFNDEIEQASNVTGNITLQADFDDAYDGPAEGDKIVIPFGDDESLEFPISFIPDENGLDKQAIGNRGYNTEFITWTVDVNKNLQTIENAQLTDKLTQGDHSFIEDSFEIYELDMNADGSFNEPLIDVTESLLDNGFTLSLSDDEFDLAMGTIDSAYRLVYQTEINDRVGEEYKNGATLIGDDLELNTDATVAVTRGVPLAKEATGYDDVNQTIDWEVKYNYDEKEISQAEAKLTDVFGDANQTLNEDSFEVFLVSIDPDTGEETGQEPYTDYSLTVTENGYVLEFDEDITDAFKIRYQTNTIDRVDEDANVTNEISDEFDNTSEGSQSIGQGILIKNNTDADYQEKTTDWSVTINRDEQLMQNTVFVDTLPDGFTFDQDSLSISGYSGDYEVAYNAENSEVKVTFNDNITERVTISYTTDIDYNLVERDADGKILSGYSNSASVKWIPEGEENSVSKSGSAIFNPDEFTRNNGFKFGSYNVADKEITWTIGVNYNEENLENVIVNDPISGNQNFDIENVAIYEMNMTPGADDFELGEDVTDSDDFTITPETDPVGFNVSFGNISEGYVIVFTTDFEGQSVEEKYENTATVESDNREEANLEASVSPRFGGEFSTKQGRQSAENGRIVNWTVNVNFSQSEIENLVIEDTPSINQTILQDTLRIYETTATESNILKDENATLTEGNDYTITFTEDEDGQESYTITFINDKSTIDRAYVLEYDTYILYEGDGNIANDLSISGEQVAEDEGGSTVNQTISFNNISGSITGEVGALQIGKIDAEDNDKSLEGAVFHLYDETGEVLIRTGTTDENGALRFVNLLYGEYQLEEVSPPDDYALDPNADNPQTVEVNADSGTVGEADVTVQNYEIKRDVRLTKIDGTTGETLEGVTFRLFDNDDNQIDGDYDTDSNGVIYIEDLAPGDYYFKESEAREHYQDNDTEYHFTIKEDHIILDIDADAITVENELIPGSGFMGKIDADRVSGDNRLEGATFRIVNIDQDPEINFSRTVTSDADGRIDTGDLRPGSYTIEEVSAPSGFELSGQDPIEFEIERSQADPIEISSDPFENNVKTTAIEVTKQDSINGQMLPGAEFELTYSEGDYYDSSTPFSALTRETDENGILRFEDLKPGTYELRETESPEGYIADDTPIEVTVTLGDVHNERTVGVTVDNDPFANITLTKVDSETGTSLGGAVFALEDDDENVIDGFDELVTDAEGKISITGLPAGDYQIREVTAPDGYEIQDGGFISDVLKVDETVTETIELEIGDVRNDIIKGSVRVVKVDGESNERLENVEFTLRAVDLVNGGTYSETSHTTDSNGEIIVEDLRPGSYVFEEVNPLAGYQPHWGDIGFEIDFPHDEAQIDIEVLNYELITVDVEKQWNDGDNANENRPDLVSVELLQDGETTGNTIDLTSANDWQHTFENLDAVDENGEFYSYTVAELHPGQNYQLQGSIDGNQTEGFTITNVETRSIDIEKIWLDDQNRLNERPDRIEVQLYQNGEPIGETEELTGPQWTTQFPDLPVYDASGALYNYAVEETTEDGRYELVEVSGNQDSGFEIVNRLTGEVDIPVIKEWLDTDGSAERPSTIVVDVYQKLYNDAEYLNDAFDRLVISPDSEGHWEGEFTGLPEFDEQGKEYDYEIVEVPVPGYSSSVTDEDGEVTIINTRTGKVAVEGVKSWQDDDEADRPDEVTVNLLRNQTVVDSVTVTENENWQYSFTDLPEFDENGATYTYTLSEHDVPGYAVSIDGFDLTNTRSELRDIEVTKGWLDDNNPERPDEITITLLGNGSPVETVNMTDEDGWVHVFEDLDAFDGQGQAISYSVEEDAIEGYETQIDGFNITNLRSETMDIDVNKTWLDDQNATGERPDFIVVELFRSDDPDKAVDTKVIRNSDDWQHTFTDMEKFDQNGVAYSYEIVETPVSGYEVSTNAVESGFELTNLRQGTISIDVMKEWNDQSSTANRPDDITVFLYRSDDSDTPYASATIENDGGLWSHTFEDLDQFDDQGVAYNYVVEEEPVENYNTEPLSGNPDEGFVITNTLQTEVAVEKIWLDTEETEDRPDSVIIDLIRDGNVYDTNVIDESTQWQAVFEGLSKYTPEGDLYEYTVEERDVTDAYTLAEISGSAEDGYTVTNLRTGEVTVEGTKTWQDDNESDRPEAIRLNLLQNQAVIETMEVTSEDDWSYAFTDLPEFDENGEAYEYAVTEQDVPGYAVTVDGFDLTNTRSEQRDIEVTKGWLDDHSEDRPEEITVTLFANGQAMETVEIKEEDEWVYVFDDLESYDEQGQAISYSIEEESVDGYETTIDGFNITNLRVGETEVEGAKVWLDEQSSEMRPDVIEVHLYQNGSLYETVEVTEATDWTYSFTDLDKYDGQGKMIEYTVDESAVDGYTTVINGFEITNVRSGITQIPVEKVWLDDEDATDARPDSITVQLFRSDDEETSYQNAILDANGEWTYEFSDLPLFDDRGQPYEYQVREVPVEGYSDNIVVQVENGYVVTNTRYEEIDLDVTKVWLDGEDTSARPETITVDLYRNDNLNEPLDSIVLDGSYNSWYHTFENLDRFDEDGVEYVYSVEEREILEGYELKDITLDDENLFTVTNLRTGEVTVEGTKTWQDDNESDRPEAIRLNLLQNQAVIETMEVTSEDDWSYAFTDLPEFDENGEAYEYAVTEQDVPGYAVTVDGFDLTNTRSEQRDIEVTKGWLDDHSEDRPEEITVTLFANGQAMETVEIKEEDEWVYVFEDLESYDEQGQAISYSIEEESVDGYETTIDGFNITNLRVGDKTVSGTKTWVNDSENQRPETIDVLLLQNGQQIDEVEVGSSEDWTFMFNNLPAFDSNGKAYVYSVEEGDVPGYQAEIVGFDIINTYQPPGEKETDEPDESESESSSDKDGGTLPSTATNMYLYLFAGLMLVLAGVGTLIAGRRKNRKSE
ncbi:Cna B-type domain-containing protein [Salisediminibacterium selenitireducens]|uniref:LPXTG-motif cell wall anchor domain protein n=1 Tax=Bacillus selenitireducens (strain ATCC 700615 / DSM 15326 / MLS10) TaxID=439292 RepID=D6XY69_BACIE|nr:Cna B-type domain-containing protein [Salisediminibacterium selenitireducens]ADH98142.1 LPXTG-motif cell wall anchor domain protein [[Bacillus] selenitireducens MLS10]